MITIYAHFFFMRIFFYAHLIIYYNMLICAIKILNIIIINLRHYRIDSLSAARQMFLLVLKYITNSFLVLLSGFSQYETERLQYVDLAKRDNPTW
jgi:hypothetical protein